MISYTYEGTTYYFFESNKIKVYPSAYRGLGYNPEAKMLSEYTTINRPLTHWKNNYVVKYEAPTKANPATATAEEPGQLNFVINGYYFEITLSASDLNCFKVENNLNHWVIRTRDVEIGASDPAKTTPVLSSIFYKVDVSGTNSDAKTSGELDSILSGSTSAFLGLRLQQNIPSIDNNDFEFTPFKLDDANNIILDKNVLLPKVYGGEGTNSIVINDINSTAIGNYSSALGYHTIAEEDYQHVFGKYNDPVNNTVEIVGNGNSSQRNNARTLDWSGNEWLAGNLTANNLLPNDTYTYDLGDEDTKWNIIRGQKFKAYDSETNIADTTAGKRSWNAKYSFFDKDGTKVANLGAGICNDSTVVEMGVYNKDNDTTEGDNTKYVNVRLISFPDENETSGYKYTFLPATGKNNPTTEVDLGGVLNSTTYSWNNIYGKRLEISSDSSISGTGDPKDSVLLIGNKSGYHLEFDKQKIMAKSSSAQSQLYIQNDGGWTQFGGGVVPKGNASINLGDSTQYWKDAYIGTVHGNLNGNADTSSKWYSDITINTNSYADATSFTAASTAVSVNGDKSSPITLKLPENINVRKLRLNDTQNIYGSPTPGQDTLTLGTSAYKWKDIYLNNSAIIGGTGAETGDKKIQTTLQTTTDTISAGTVKPIMTVKYRDANLAGDYIVSPIGVVGNLESGNTHNNGPIFFGSTSGATFLGGGESGQRLPVREELQHVTSGSTIPAYNTENLYLTADNRIYLTTTSGKNGDSSSPFETNSIKSLILESGNVYPSINNTYSLGGSFRTAVKQSGQTDAQDKANNFETRYWKEAYITTVHGNLDGTAAKARNDINGNQIHTTYGAGLAGNDTPNISLVNGAGTTISGTTVTVNNVGISNTSKAIRSGSTDYSIKITSNVNETAGNTIYFIY